MYFRFLLLLIVASFFQSVVAAPDDSHFSAGTIDDDLSYILQHHPKIKASAEKLSAAQSRSKLTGWYPDPVLGFTFMDAPYKKDPADLSPKAFMGEEWMLSQSIPTPGRLSVESDITDLEFQIEALRYTIVSNEIASSFVRDLTAAWRIKHHLDLTRRYLARFQPMVSISGAQYAMGKGNLTDLSMARLSSRELEERLQQYDKDHDSSMNQLTYYLPKEQMHDLESINQFAERLLTLIKKDDREISKMSAELQLAQFNVTIQEKKVALSKLDYMPDFTIFARYLRSKPGNAEPPPLLADNQLSVGLTMRIPLWSAFSNHHGVNEAKSTQNASQFDYDDLNRAATTAKQSLLTEIDSATRRLDLYRNRMIPEANRAVSAAREGYQSGSTEFSSVLRVWDTLYRLEMDAVELEAERLNKIFELGRILNLIQPQQNSLSEAEKK